MLKKIAAAALLCSSGAAHAVTYFGQIEGRVTEQFATYFTTPDAPSTISVGDRIVATFSYSTGADNGGVSGAMGSMLMMLSSNLATFKINDHVWTSRSAFLGYVAPPAFASGGDALADYYATMDDAVGAGDLHVEGYAFEIGEFGYDLYQGHGYKGVFDATTLVVTADGKPFYGQKLERQVNAVPEPATWALMIGGFALAGSALRLDRRARRARFVQA